MTEHGRILDDLFGERVTVLQQAVDKLIQERAELEKRLAFLEGALARAAAYLGVAHVLKDPTV